MYSYVGNAGMFNSKGDYVNNIISDKNFEYSLRVNKFIDSLHDSYLPIHGTCMQELKYAHMLCVTACIQVYTYMAYTQAR